MGGVKWAADAIEGTSVQFEKPSQIVDMGVISPSFNDGRFQLSFWFKRKRRRLFLVTGADFKCNVELRDVNGSTLQIGSKGSSVEIFMATAVRSQKVSLGSGLVQVNGTTCSSPMMKMPAMNTN